MTIREQIQKLKERLAANPLDDRLASLKEAASIASESRLLLFEHAGLFASAEETARQRDLLLAACNCFVEMEDNAADAPYALTLMDLTQFSLQCRAALAKCPKTQAVT